MRAIKRGLKQSKKADLEYEFFFNMFGMVLAVVIGIALFLFVDDVREQTIFEKNYVVRDSSSVINAIYAAPGDVVYVYDEEMEDFTIDFKENSVEAFREEDDTRLNKVFYMFGEDKDVEFQYESFSNLEENDRFKFSKSSQLVVELIQHEETE